MGDLTYTIGEVAKLLGVEGKNNSTVRLWTATFADWLSPSSRPERGQLRLYTRDDVKVLMDVRDLRRRHLSYEEIRARFATGEIGRGDKVGEETVVATKDEGEPVQAVRLEELKETLTPLTQLPEALDRLAKETDRVGFGFQMHFGRLHVSLEALNEKLDQIQNEVQALRTAQMSSNSRQAREAESTIERQGIPTQPSPPQKVPNAGPKERAANKANPVPEGTAAPSRQEIIRSDGAGARAIDLASPPTLNQYGLRPFPPGFSSQSLGLMFLCRMCGSKTRPLGITPTSRAVLSCIECGERITVPMAKIEDTLGRPRGLWSRLWAFFTGPFSHSRVGP